MIVFEDEASFRQTPTLHATWAWWGSEPKAPTRGERHTQKIVIISLTTAPWLREHVTPWFLEELAGALPAKDRIEPGQVWQASPADHSLQAT